MDGEKQDNMGDAHELIQDSEGNGLDDGKGNIEAGDTSNTGQKRNLGNIDNENTIEKAPSTRMKLAPKLTLEKRTKSDKRNSKFHRSKGPATSGSLDHLPEKGQTVHWRSLQGWVDGTVVEVAHEETDVEGKAKYYPVIVIRSKNGKIAVHKPSMVYFDGGYKICGKTQPGMGNLGHRGPSDT